MHAAHVANVTSANAFEATSNDPASEVSRLRRRPEEFRDGARCAFLRRFDGQREPGGYPLGFHGWQLERRNAWFAGFNRGFYDRLRITQQGTA